MSCEEFSEIPAVPHLLYVMYCTVMGCWMSEYNEHLLEEWNTNQIIK